MITVSDAELLEREEELDTLRALVADAREGRGGIALVEGAPGSGKTALLRAVRAGASDLRVLSAVGSELEREFPYGVIRQLVGPAAPGHALEGPFDLTGDACFDRLHALIGAVVQLAAEQPLVLLVDDLQWADPGSLKTLGMLARRVEDLPIALVAALRPAHDPCIDALYAAPGAICIRPEPLSHDAIAHVVAEAVDGEADPAFVAAAAETTGGNPLLVRELKRTLAAEAYTGSAGEAERVRRAVPGSIARLVQGRLWRLAPAAVALARAVAALGDRPPLEIANALAGLDHTVAANAHASLAAVGLLEPGALRFTHPMMREATLAGLVPATRSCFHRRAALLLFEAGASEEEVAAQVLAAEPGNDPRAARLLQTTGERALAAGDAAVALQHLKRALSESGADPAPDLLLAIGLAEARSGGSDALLWLRRAAEVGPPVVAARAEQARSRVLVLAARAREAAAALDRGRKLIAGVDEALAAELEDDLFDALGHDYDLAAERRLRLDVASERPVVLAHRAFDAAAAGAPAEEVRALALRALGDGTLVAAPERPAVLYAIEALMAAEAADEARAAVQALQDSARRAGSQVGAAGVATLLTRWEHEFGTLEAAQDAARAAVELQTQFSGRLPNGPVRAGLAAALLDAGDVDEAERVLGPVPGQMSAMPICGYHSVRGRVLLARGRVDEAIAELQQQLEIERPLGWTRTFREPTRATLAVALADAGRIDEARAVIEAGTPRTAGETARSLLAQARLALVREDELRLLGEAVEAARRSPSPLIQAEAAFALGFALRRAGRRSESRDPLRHARELALCVGAKALEERAHEELVIAGARPQRVALAGVDGLTPSERRVAELAAAGRRNREIAEHLVVTLKTVEVHLGRAYGKLGISSRSQLAAALS